jgi:hypothetical protein
MKSAEIRKSDDVARVRRVNGSWLQDDDSEHLKFPVYMRSAPERILARELADKDADLRGSCGSACAPTASRFPRPVEAEAPPVPADQRVRLKDGKSGEAPRSDTVQPNQ